MFLKLFSGNDTKLSAQIVFDPLPCRAAAFRCCRHSKNTKFHLMVIIIHNDVNFIFVFRMNKSLFFVVLIQKLIINCGLPEITTDEMSQGDHSLWNYIQPINSYMDRMCRTSSTIISFNVRLINLNEIFSGAGDDLFLWNTNSVILFVIICLIISSGLV